MEIENKTIQVDTSGAGQGWRVADENSCPANVQQEIAAEIIDGKVTETRDYLASNGIHYRWSIVGPEPSAVRYFSDGGGLL